MLHRLYITSQRWTAKERHAYTCEHHTTDKTIAALKYNSTGIDGLFKSNYNNYNLKLCTFLWTQQKYRWNKNM